MDAIMWGRSVHTAIQSGDVAALCGLLRQNDPNGTYTYDDCCAEFGEQSREQWACDLMDCGWETLATLGDHLTDAERAENADILEVWADCELDL